MFILIEFTITNWTRSENFEIFTDYDKSYSLCEIPVANRRFGQIAVPAFGVGQIFINPAKSIQDRVDLARDFSRKYRNRIRREKSGQIVAAAKLNGDWPNPFKIGARKHSKSDQIKGIILSLLLGLPPLRSGSIGPPPPWFGCDLRVFRIAPPVSRAISVHSAPSASRSPLREPKSLGKLAPQFSTHSDLAKSFRIRPNR